MVRQDYLYYQKEEAGLLAPTYMTVGSCLYLFSVTCYHHKGWSLWRAYIFIIFMDISNAQNLANGN